MVSLAKKCLFLLVFFFVEQEEESNHWHLVGYVVSVRAKPFRYSSFTHSLSRIHGTRVPPKKGFHIYPKSPAMLSRGKYIQNYCSLHLQNIKTTTDDANFWGESLKLTSKDIGDKNGIRLSVGTWLFGLFWLIPTSIFMSPGTSIIVQTITITP